MKLAGWLDFSALISLLQGLFNEKWASILRGLATGCLEQFVQNHQVLREISLILRVNERMVVAVGPACHAQLANIYCDMLKIYKVCHRARVKPILSMSPR